jgi:NifU-like protein involved in Fe-S cluster formation
LRRFATLPSAGDFPADLPGVRRASAGDQGRGAEVQLAALVEADRIVEARFLAYGCPHFLAAASWLCERVAGLSISALEAWDWHEAATALEVPPAKFGRLLTLQDAVRALARTGPVADLDSV